MRKTNTNFEDEAFDCPQGVDPEERKLLLQKIIDGLASEDEQHQFYKTLENCDRCHCREQCNQHIEIKNILKENIINKPLPVGLLEEIKTGVEKLAEGKS